MCLRTISATCEPTLRTVARVRARAMRGDDRDIADEIVTTTPTRARLSSLLSSPLVSRGTGDARRRAALRNDVPFASLTMIHGEISLHLGRRETRRTYSLRLRASRSSKLSVLIATVNCHCAVAAATRPNKQQKDSTHGNSRDMRLYASMRECVRVCRLTTCTNRIRSAHRARVKNEILRGRKGERLVLLAREILNERMRS